jgi:hypothetical protein
MTTINGLSFGVNSITIILDATPYTVPRSDALVEALREQDYERVKDLVNPQKQIEEGLSRFGDIVVQNGYVLFKGMEISNGHVRRILELTQLGLPVDSVALNLDSLMRNPSFRVRRDYSEFVDRFNLPFAPDGRSVFCKAVQEDFWSIATGKNGKVFWGVGETPKMAREDVDDDPTRTCSDGLHVCAPEYLPHFARANGHVINVLVWPEHIVALPVDYNLSKLRVCEAFSHSVMPPGDAQKYYDAIGPIFAFANDEDPDDDYVEEDENEEETSAPAPLTYEGQPVDNPTSFV